MQARPPAGVVQSDCEELALAAVEDAVDDDVDVDCDSALVTEDVSLEDASVDGALDEATLEDDATVDALLEGLVDDAVALSVDDGALADEGASELAPPWEVLSSSRLVLSEEDATVSSVDEGTVPVELLDERDDSDREPEVAGGLVLASELPDATLDELVRELLALVGAGCDDASVVPTLVVDPGPAVELQPSGQVVLARVERWLESVVAP